MDLFKKSNIIGVAVTPERGLEVAEIDVKTKTVLKYAVRPLGYNINSCQIADMDIFKETLQDMLIELSVPKNAQLVLSIPTVLFSIMDVSAATSTLETESIIEENLLSHPFFAKNGEPCFSYVKLPSASSQFNKVIYTAAQQNVISEAVYNISDLNYKTYAIDTSTSTTYNALKYIGRFDNVSSDTSWVLMIVDNLYCRITTMIGDTYTEVFEERISIGEILGDDENYSTVISVAEPILRNLPSKFLYIVSSTNLISAEVLAGKLQYSSPIIHQDANDFSKDAIINVSPMVDPNVAVNISLDVIGAAIKRDFIAQTDINLNLYNKTLGDIYTMNQPPEINGFVISNEFLFKLYMVLLLIIAIATTIFSVIIIAQINEKRSIIEKLKTNIRKIQDFLDANKAYSSDLFNEGNEVQAGLTRNKGIYSYYTIVGTEIPQKLWLTHLKLSDKTTIEGQADNLESVYSFFRNVKDYNPNSDIKLQKLGLASQTQNSSLNAEGVYDTESILNSFNADFYEFKISNEPEVTKSSILKNKSSKDKALPNLEPKK